MTGQLEIAERISSISVSSTMRVAAEAEKLRSQGVDEEPDIALFVVCGDRDADSHRLAFIVVNPYSRDADTLTRDAILRNGPLSIIPGSVGAT